MVAIIINGGCVIILKLLLYCNNFINYLIVFHTMSVICKRSSLCSLMHKNILLCSWEFFSRMMRSSVSFRRNEFCSSIHQKRIMRRRIFWKDERKHRSDFPLRVSAGMKISPIVFPFDLMSGSSPSFFASIIRDWTQSKITPPHRIEGKLDNSFKLQTTPTRLNFCSCW